MCAISILPFPLFEPIEVAPAVDRSTGVRVPPGSAQQGEPTTQDHDGRTALRMLRRAPLVAGSGRHRRHRVERPLRDVPRSGGGWTDLSPPGAVSAARAKKYRDECN